MTGLHRYGAVGTDPGKHAELMDQLPMPFPMAQYLKIITGKISNMY